MKKMLLTLVCAATALGVCAAPQEVGFDKLPKPASEYRKKTLQKETDKGGEANETQPGGGTRLLRHSGTCLVSRGNTGPGNKILIRGGGFPETAVPAKIQAYIAKEYPGETITQLTRSQKGYVVGLSDGETIPFDQNGKPAKMKHGH